MGPHPDWVEWDWTVEQFQKQYPQAAFKFKGVGWYLTAKDTLLIEPIPGCIEPRYKWSCWNQPDARDDVLDEFIRLMKLPVIQSK